MRGKQSVSQNRTQRFRAQLERDTLAVPGVFNAFTARLVEDAGFPAAYVSGAGLAASRALPDIGLLTMTEVVIETRHIIQRIQIPVLVDADTGFGDVHQVYRTVRELESAGAVGIQLEDQVSAKRCGHLPGKTLIRLRRHVSKNSFRPYCKTESRSHHYREDGCPVCGRPRWCH